MSPLPWKRVHYFRRRNLKGMDKENLLPKIWNNIERWAALFAIIFSLFSFLQSCQNEKENSKLQETMANLTEEGVRRERYFDRTNFNIIQNLWQENPTYTLYNESQKPLTLPPKPSYFMYIPVKVYYISKESGDRMSNLILLPISYDNVEKQYNTGKTVDEVVTSVLKSNFYGKLGERDVRSKLYDLNEALFLELRVYPFLAISTHIQYSYKDKPDKVVNEKFITTPWNKVTLSDDRYEDLKDYSKNMLYVKENEVITNGNESVYDTAFKKLDAFFDKISKTEQLSNEEQIRLSTLLGVRWDAQSSHDDINFEEEISKYKTFEDFQEAQNRLNFNGLGRFLSDKVVPATDPLYPGF